MGWADRLAIALAAKSSNANSAKSADSCGQEAIGTIGAFGIGGFGPADRQSDAELIEAVAIAMATKPGNRIIGPGGMDYFLSEARRRLKVNDPLALAFLADP